MKLIAAINANGIIGVDNDLPWEKLPEDMKWFKRATVGQTVVMGRNTWESMGRRSLPNRTNIIVSRTLFEEHCGSGYCSWDVAHTYIVPGITEALMVKADLDGELFFIGGAQIYASALKFVDTLYITHVHSGDHDPSLNLSGEHTITRFPDINWNEWESISSDAYPTHTSVVYTRL
jgi:dihydrofolate reductase